jgi:protein-disulfide isomerase
MPEEDSEEGDIEESPETEEAKETDNKEENTGSPGTVNISVRTVILGAFVVGLAVGFSGGVLTSQGTFSLGSEAAPSQPSDSNNQKNGETETIDMSEIEMEGEPVLGDENAEVTMVVYEDFQCPFCKRFEEGAFQQIKSNYIDPGQVKAVWKDRPLPQIGHEWAESAASAMECVYREGGNEAFWNVKEKVFANQNTVSSSNVESQIKTWAAEEGVSESAVQSCIDNGNPIEEVNKDSTEGQNLGISGTPTVVINGEKIVGAQPYGNFESVIENALS